MNQFFKKLLVCYMICNLIKSSKIISFVYIFKEIILCITQLFNKLLRWLNGREKIFTDLCFFKLLLQDFSLFSFIVLLKQVIIKTTNIFSVDNLYIYVLKINNTEVGVLQGVQGRIQVNMDQLIGLPRLIYYTIQYTLVYSSAAVSQKGQMILIQG